MTTIALPVLCTGELKIGGGGGGGGAAGEVRVDVNEEFKFL